jgi:uncharacterized protein YbcI
MRTETMEHAPSIDAFLPRGGSSAGEAACRARRIARAASVFELRLLGRLPRSVAVVGGGSLTVVTIHMGLSGIERRLSDSAEGRRRVLAWHRSLVATSFADLRDHLHAAGGIELQAVATHVDGGTGSLLKICTTAATIDVVVPGGHVAGLGLAVDEHLHVIDADDEESVRPGSHPNGVSTIEEVPHAGADAEES